MLPSSLRVKSAGCGMTLCRPTASIVTNDFALTNCGHDHSGGLSSYCALRSAYFTRSDEGYFPTPAPKHLCLPQSRFLDA